MGVNSCGQLLIDQGNFFNAGLLNWDTTAKTANFTAVNGNGYFVNTTSAAITVTLPAGSAGDFIGVSDYASTSETNAITISPNGTDKINGLNDSYRIATNGIAVSLLYVDSTRGWKAVASNSENISGAFFITATGGSITTSGDYKIHTFTGPGTFTVTCAGNPSGSDTVDYMVVAGGGGGGMSGCSGAGGGGGAGGFRTSSGTASGCYSTSPLGSGVSALPLSVTSYPITIGGGGSGAIGRCTLASPGNPSIFSTITSAGGGRAGSHPNSEVDGAPGGSGGGGGGSPAVSGIGGTGNTPPVSPPQGNPGGNKSGQIGGGGGGAGGAGGTNAGGSGTPSSITTAAVTYSEGGQGRPSPQSPGPANSGDGGEGNRGPDASVGGAGGSGIVIIRYKYQ